ncbi:MAG TPA: dockerin type I domain-containing protein [Candidatus Dormibacteraeota bacterium]|nr:dockerin type I domain-containing protein [Candidatus Dormibacteraeota bacterium]
MGSTGAKRPSLLLSLLILAALVTLQFAPVHAASFTSPQQVPMGTTLSSDNLLRFTDNSPTNGTALKRDSLFKYYDQNTNNHWDPGEPVIYDLNNDSFYESIEPVIAGSLPIGSQLKADLLIKYVDISGKNHWDPGDPVVYDTTNSGSYLTGKPVIAGTPLVQGALLASDNHVKFIGAGSTWTTGNTVVYDSNNDNQYSASRDSHLKYVDSNANGRWDQGEAVIYDSNLNGVYDSGEPVLSGTAPTSGTTLRTDTKIMFVDANRNGAWDSGEAIVYDSNGDGMFDTTPSPSDIVIVAANPPTGVALSFDSKVKYVDGNGNNVWNQGEVVVYDSVGMGYFNATIDPKIKFWDVNSNGIYDSGDSVIVDKLGTGIYGSNDIVLSGPTPPNDGSAILSIDHHFHFVDTQLAGHWLSGDTVIYDADSDHVYVTGDPIITGTAPANGTPLIEPVISGATPSVGTALKQDPKMKYIDLNANVVWNPGEPVIYDNNNDGVYDTTPSPSDIVVVGTSPTLGTLLSEPVVSGPTPTVGSSLKSDPNLKFVGSGSWTPGQTVVYDTNGNGHYDRGEPVIADGAPGDGSWHSGEVVAYDTNNNSVYNSGEPIIYGTAQLDGTSLASDAKIRYVDANSNGHWDVGETVAYDLNNNSVYDSGDVLILGSAPASNIFLAPAAAMDYQNRIWLTWTEKLAGGGQTTTVYFKTGDGTNWSAKQSVTPGSFIDTNPEVAPLVNSTMMVLWSSNRSSSAPIFYRFYSAFGSVPFQGTGPVQLTSSSMYDHSPSAVQDRNGRIWVVWARANPQGTSSQIYYKYFNGTAWSSDFALPPAIVSKPFEVSPQITQTKDGNIMIVWASNATSNANLNIFYTTTPDTMTTLPTTGIPSGSWSAANRFAFGDTSDEDDHPSFLQSQDGNFWIFFQRSIVSPSSEFLYYSSATSIAGLTTITQMTSGSDSAATSVQNSDHYVWIFYNSVVSSGQQIYSLHTTTTYLGNDLGVRQLSRPTPLIRSYYPVNLTTLVQNYGSSLESAMLTLQANSTVLSTWAVSLAAGQSQKFYYNWTNPAWGRYTVSATLSNISPANSGNNQDTFVQQLLRVSPPGDVNGDGTVNILDLALIAFCFNTVPVPGTQCNGFVDVNRDGQINIQDLALAAFYYTKSV